MAQDVNLRRSIAVIYNQPDSSTIVGLRNYAVMLSQQRHSSASRALTSLTRKGFGSGIVVERDGRKYVATNSHVVGVGGTCRVVFYVGKEQYVADSCRCVYRNNNADIALLELSDVVDSIAQPLTLSLSPVRDGDEVFSAGYPGIGGNPSWQFGKGIVSNAELYLSDSTIALIQHTAQIDKGSSGSPLLVHSGEGYLVQGVNTLKITEREGVGVAVPAEHIDYAMRNIGYNDVTPLIDSLLAMDYETYTDAYSKMPRELVDRQDTLYSRGEFLKALTMVIQFADTVNLAKLKKRPPEYGNSYTIVRVAGKNRTKKSYKVPAQRGLDKDYHVSNTVFFGFQKSFDRSGMVIDAGWHHSINSLGRLGVDLSFIGKTDKIDFAFSPAFIGGVQFPCYINKFHIVPFITPAIGVGVGAGSGMMLRFGGRAGVDFTFLKVPLFFGVLVDANDFLALKGGNNYFLPSAGVKLGMAF